MANWSPITHDSPLFLHNQPQMTLHTKVITAPLLVQMDLMWYFQKAELEKNFKDKWLLRHVMWREGWIEGWGEQNRESGRDNTKMNCQPGRDEKYLAQNGTRDPLGTHLRNIPLRKEGDPFTHLCLSHWYNDCSTSDCSSHRLLVFWVSSTAVLDATPTGKARSPRAEIRGLMRTARGLEAALKPGQNQSLLLWLEHKTGGQGRIWRGCLHWESRWLCNCTLRYKINRSAYIRAVVYESPQMVTNQSPSSVDEVQEHDVEHSKGDTGEYILDLI